MYEKEKSTFESLDYGTVVSSLTTDTITVKIDPTLMVDKYAKAYVEEMERRNPERYRKANGKVDISEDELKAYFRGLLAIRIDSIHRRCKVWRDAKTLYLPTWIQFVVSQVGRVVDYTKGIIIEPEIDEEYRKYDINKLCELSIRLHAYAEDGLTMQDRAFPPQPDGDPSTMGYQVINNYVLGMEKSQPIYSYVAAFLGFKIDQENKLAALYRVKYDDIAFIERMLMNEPKLMQ